MALWQVTGPMKCGEQTREVTAVVCAPTFEKAVAKASRQQWWSSSSGSGRCEFRPDVGNRFQGAIVKHQSAPFDGLGTLGQAGKRRRRKRARRRRSRS